MGILSRDPFVYNGSDRKMDAVRRLRHRQPDRWPNRPPITLWTMVQVLFRAAFALSRRRYDLIEEH
jgi:hypothetical protein